MLEKWTYDGTPITTVSRATQSSSRTTIHARPQPEFASLLGAQLKVRAVKYTPHYTEPFMGHRRRELVDGTNGVYRYDQRIALRTTHMPAALLEAGSIINRREELELAKPQRVAQRIKAEAA